MRSNSAHDIFRNKPCLPLDRITRFASPNRFDVRAAPCSFLDSRSSYRLSGGHSTNFAKFSKFRSTMPTGLCLYASNGAEGASTSFNESLNHHNEVCNFWFDHTKPDTNIAYAIDKQNSSALFSKSGTVKTNCGFCQNSNIQRISLSNSIRSNKIIHQINIDKQEQDQNNSNLSFSGTLVEATTVPPFRDPAYVEPEPIKQSMQHKNPRQNSIELNNTHLLTRSKQDMSVRNNHSDLPSSMIISSSSHSFVPASSNNPTETMKSNSNPNSAQESKSSNPKFSIPLKSNSTRPKCRKPKPAAQIKNEPTKTNLAEQNGLVTKPLITLVDSRPRTRLLIPAGSKTHLKTMTVQRDLVFNHHSFEKSQPIQSTIHDSDLISTSHSAIVDVVTDHRKRTQCDLIRHIPISPSMPLASETLSGRWVYNISLSDETHSKLPTDKLQNIYSSSSELIRTSLSTIDSNINPELTKRLDNIAKEIGLININKMMYTTSLSTEYSTNAHPQSSNASMQNESDFDQFSTKYLSTNLSYPVSTHSSLSPDRANLYRNEHEHEQSPESDIGFCSDEKEQQHFSREHEMKQRHEEDFNEIRPASTGNRIFKKFLRHISPKIKRSLSGTTGLSEAIHNNQRQVNHSSDEQRSSSILRVFPRRLTMSKRQESGLPGPNETPEPSTIPCSISLDMSIYGRHMYKTRDSERMINPISSQTQSPIPSVDVKQRPLSIALPIDDLSSVNQWDQRKLNQQHFENNSKGESSVISVHTSPEPTYLNASVSAFGYGRKPEWKHFSISPSARRLAYARKLTDPTKPNSFDVMQLQFDQSANDISQGDEQLFGSKSNTTIAPVSPNFK